MVKINVAGDIWRTWYYDFGEDADGYSRTIPITYDLMQELNGVTLDTLYEASLRNASSHAVMMTLSSMIADLIGTPTAPDDMNVPDIYVITTDDKRFGASSIFAPAIKRQIKDRFPHGCFILPSSIHELLLVDTVHIADLSGQVCGA